MAECLAFHQRTDGTPDDGIWFQVYREVATTVEMCGDSDPDERVMLTTSEYTDLVLESALQAGLGAGDSATMFLAGICVLCAIFGYKTGINHI